MEFNFLSAMYDCNQLYGVTFTNSDDFAEIAYGAWEQIGNKRTRLYRYIGHPEGPNNQIVLPCNADIIVAVTTFPEEWNDTSNIYNNGDLKSFTIEQSLEFRERRENPLKPHGHYVHFELVGNSIYVDNPYPEVEILYKGILLDEDDLPKINEKEKRAIATYVAYVRKFKEGLMTNNTSLISIANKLQQMWSLQCIEARSPESISQNEMDEIANAKSRWAGKRYGKSYKPMLH